MSRVVIPEHKLSEELINSITHGIGAGLGVAALVLCVVKAAVNGSAIGVVGSCLYGAGMIIAYVISCIYHALARNRAKVVFRVLDHCDIFFMIACTYTPFCLISLKGAVGWVLFGVVWGLAALGIVFNAVNLEKFSKPSTVVYVLIGWCVIFAIKPLYEAIGTGGLMFLVLGGVLYTIGAVLYGIGSKVRYMHSVFHLFVIAGSVMQFFAVYLYVL